MSRHMFAAALEEGPEGLRLELLVAPSASASRFPDRYDPWRKRIGVRVQAPAQAGRANQEVIRLVARFFGCSEQDVDITSGGGRPLKTLLVRGVDLEQATRRLAGELQ